MNNQNIYVDIDNTITFTKGIDYKNSIPRKERIDIINKLYDEGNIITYWTGRGTVSGIDWSDLTKNQLNKWGAKHHNLLLGKPSYDIFIDDKSFNCENYFCNK
jgi:CMP-N,N'-diacetyllegionaminic acid synthase